MLLLSWYVAFGEPSPLPGWARRMCEWFLVHHTYTRAVFFAIVEGVVWELFEWTLDRVRLSLPFHLAAAQDGWTDTLLDIAVAIPTAMLAMAAIRWHERRRRSAREPVAVCAAP
ncbi:MAG: hypothetical protein Q8R39_04395 [bacterium]|nr:hypothetical protein [bacterium]MDZ4284572.1 hypothetical protein [Patescibacteria group bacterium]